MGSRNRLASNVNKPCQNNIIALRTTLTNNHRWMGETRVLVETVAPTHEGDLERLKNLSRCFPDARYIWETSSKYFYNINPKTTASGTDEKLRYSKIGGILIQKQPTWDMKMSGVIGGLAVV